jgi:hypothetical protein
MLPLMSMVQPDKKAKKKTSSFAGPMTSLMQLGGSYHNQTTSKGMAVTAHGKLKESTKKSMFERV